MTEENNEGKKAKKARKALPRLKTLKSTGQQEEHLGGDGELSLAGCIFTAAGNQCQTRANVGCLQLTDPC